MSINTAHYSNIASKASVSHHFLCVQCARLAIMAMAGRNRAPQILRLATGLECNAYKLPGSVLHFKAVSKIRERILRTFEYQAIVLSLYLDGHCVLPSTHVSIFDPFNYIGTRKLRWWFAGRDYSWWYFFLVFVIAIIP